MSLTKVSTSIWRQIVQLDPVGTIHFLPGVVCFLLALQWGGTMYPWSNGPIIVLFALTGVFLIAFIAVQIWRQEDATIPPCIIKQRSIACGAVYALCVGGDLISTLYTLAIWFHAVKVTTAVRSKIDTIPMVSALVIGGILSGAVITRTGPHNPWMFVSAILMTTGSRLITTF
jgi:hypothetical protein